MRSTFFLFFCLFCQSIVAQLPPEGLNQIDTQDWLWENYYLDKHRTYSYEAARTQMYSFIDNTDIELVCVYSGYRMDWSPNNPSNNPQPINCEHTVPRSFYNEAYPMFSDIHHLFPTYNRWNTARWNYRFGEIEDERTQSWMYLNINQSYIPSSNIDAYSEVRGTTYSNALFEPREDHKGDLARAVFYFYTMYPNIGDIEDVANLNTLCDWNQQDPVSEKEMERNNRIEIVQGTRNPYVDYPSLTTQAWGCSSLTTSTENLVQEDFQFDIFPNPAQTYIELSSNLAGTYEVQIVDMLGKILTTAKHHLNTKIIDIEHLPKGVYNIQIRKEDRFLSQNFHKL